MASPQRAPPRVRTRRGFADPVTVTSTTSGPGDRVTLPPASATLAAAAIARKPSTRPSRLSSASVSGSARESSARRGVPPIAATSLTLTASAFQPTSAGALNRQSKCTPSTSASVVRISSAPRSGAATAASSPGPACSQAGASGRRARIRAIRPRSPTAATVAALTGVLNGAGLPDDGDLDLPRILQLVFDAPRDVLREPHRLLVRHAVAFDDDADLAAGLEGERLRHALERVRDVLQLFEPLHVRLEDVAACPRPRGRDRVGRLDDHRFERRPVDVHVVRGDRLQDRLPFAVLAEEVEPQLQVRPLQIAIDGLADVVQKRRARGDVAVEADFLGHDAREKRDLARVVQHVLPVAGAELQPAHQPQDLGVKIVEAQLERRRLSLAAHRLFDLAFDLLDDFL